MMLTRLYVIVEMMLDQLEHQAMCWNATALPIDVFESVSNHLLALETCTFKVNHRVQPSQTLRKKGKERKKTQPCQ
jgi:hypothetical protein